MDLAVDRERGGVHRPVALDDLAFVVDADEVRDADEAEAHPERVDPEQLRVLGVAPCQVPGHSLVEPETVEQAEGGRHPLLHVDALLVGRREVGELVGLAIGHGCGSRSYGRPSLGVRPGRGPG
jgi:hypothetical protein